MQSVKVSIHGIDYNFKGDNPEQIKRLAAVVDRSMRELDSTTNPKPPLNLAVLTALNLAETIENDRNLASQPDLFIDTELENMIKFTDGLLSK